jgi:gamma-glutamylcyclotransferase (GGCT)/AIG2-like uncharacterized protein YtfP
MQIREILTEAGAAPIYYFSYGMLCDPKYMQAAELMGVAELRNFRYEMLQYANVVADTGGTVYGCLWSLDRDMLSQLDQIEGYPILYDRKTVPAYVDGQKYVAELYTMTPETRDQLQGSRPSQGYINSIVRGYHAAGVPMDQLRQSLRGLPKKSAVSEAAIGTLNIGGLSIIVDDHAVERTEYRNVNPDNIDLVLRKLPSIRDQLQQIPNGQKFWVYDPAVNIALGLRAINGEIGKYVFKTVIGKQPFERYDPIIELN